MGRKSRLRKAQVGERTTIDPGGFSSEDDVTLGERSSVQAVKSSRRRPPSPPTSPSPADPSTEVPDAEEGTKASGSEYVTSEGELDDNIIDITEEGSGKGWEAEIEAAAGPTAAAGKRSKGKKAARRVAAAEKLRAAHRRSKRGTKRAVPTETLPSKNRRSVMDPNTEPSAWSICTEDESSGSGDSPVPIVEDDDMSEEDSGHSLPGFEMDGGPASMNQMPLDWNVPREPVPDLIARHCSKEPPLEEQQATLKAQQVRVAEGQGDFDQPKKARKRKGEKLKKKTRKKKL